MMQYVLKNGIILDGTENMKPVTGHMIRVNREYETCNRAHDPSRK